MKKYFAIISLLILFAGYHLNAFSQEGSEQKSPADIKAEKENKLKIAKAVLADRKEMMKHRTAMTMFENICREYSSDYELLWTTSKLYYYFAQRFKEDTDKAIPYNKKGAHYGKQAMNVNPSGYDGKIWWAMNYVMASINESKIKILAESKKIKAFLEKMMSEKPERFEAYMMLGGMYRSLPGSPLAWGDNDKSLEILKKADKLAPDNPEVLIEIAETYVELGKKDEAVKYYRKAETAPSPEGMEFETEDAHDYAKKRIKEIQ
jgi:tetratricopeptide (TPR) repeat protein